MEDLSLTAFWLALIATAAAGIFYWTHLLGVRLVMRRLTTDAGEGPLVTTVERSDAGALGALVQPVVLALLAVTAAFFPADIRPLVPALQNADLLAIHVATMILAYGALSVSFGAAVLYLAQGNRTRPGGGA